MPPSSSSSIKPGDRFKEGIAVKVFKDATAVRAAKFHAHDDGTHILLGRPASATDQANPGEIEYDFDGQRVLMHADSAPHPASWLHPA